jgi:putative two-component system protein, hydrogenase maturation factor HypX/HoxX
MAALAIIYQIITTLDKLTIYRKFKLTQMYANFYGNENYQNARNRFVYKMKDDKTTPENIASHRRKEG